MKQKGLRLSQTEFENLAKRIFVEHRYKWNVYQKFYPGFLNIYKNKSNYLGVDLANSLVYLLQRNQGISHFNQR